MKVGDKLLLAYSRRRGETRDVTVSRVGRKWAYLAECPAYRIALTEYRGYSAGSVYFGNESVGTIWQSREEYDAALRLLEKRRVFTERVRNDLLPRDMDKLNAAWAILWGDGRN